MNGVGGLAGKNDGVKHGRSCRQTQLLRLLVLIVCLTFTFIVTPNYNNSKYYVWNFDTVGLKAKTSTGKLLVPQSKGNLGDTARWDTCRQEQLRPMSDMQWEWYAKDSPILHSIIHFPTEDVDRLVFVFQGRIKVEHREAWLIGAKWTCGRDRRPALSHGWEANNNTMINLKPPFAFEITCPSMTLEDDVVDVVKANDDAQADMMVYNFSAWNKCRQEDRQSDLGIPEGSTDLIVCVMVKDMRWELAQWIDYHRIVGFQHFLVYLHEYENKLGYYDNDTELQRSSDITYIPWNYEFPYGEEGQKGQIPFQALQWMDCKLRAQVRNVKWLADHDVDEYFVIEPVIGENGKLIPSPNVTLRSILQEHESNQDMALLQVPSWFHGNAGGDRLFPTNDTTPVGSYHPTLVMDNVWKAKEAFVPEEGRAGRQKIVVRPERVQYSTFHELLLSAGKKYEVQGSDPRIRMHHHKRRGTIQGSPFARFSFSNSTNVRDTWFRDQYGPILRDHFGLPPLPPDDPKVLEGPQEFPALVEANLNSCRKCPKTAGQQQNRTRKRNRRNRNRKGNETMFGT